MRAALRVTFQLLIVVVLLGFMGCATMGTGGVAKEFYDCDDVDETDTNYALVENNHWNKVDVYLLHGGTEIKLVGSVTAFRKSRLVRIKGLDYKQQFRVKVYRSANKHKNRNLDYFITPYIADLDTGKLLKVVVNNQPFYASVEIWPISCEESS